MSQNVQFGISKFPGIWTLALSYIVPLNHSSLGTKYELDVQSVHNYVGNMKATGSQLG